MLKLGSQKIPSLYVGEEKIKKAYVGGNLVFGEEKSGGHDLPEGYTELEYITIGPSLTFSGFLLPLLDQNSVYTFDVEIEKWGIISGANWSPYAAHIFYAYNIASKTEYAKAGIWMMYEGLYTSALSTDVGTSKAVIKTLTEDVSVSQKMLLVYDALNQRVGINDAFVPLPTKPSNAQNTYLGSNLSANNQSAYRWGDASMRVYGVKAENALYAGPTYNCDWIPAKNTNGIVGFYDLVSNSFKTPKTGEVAAGPEI